MAHNLLITGDKAAMAYVGQPPWHGLGTQLDHAATSAQMLKAAGLDWRVMKVPLYAIQGAGSLPAPQRMAVVREDLWGKPGCTVLGVVGRGYLPLQNSEAFGFFDQLIGQGAAVYHTAGALGHGERVWILAKLPDPIRVVGDDLADKYLLLSTGHDGRTCVQMKFTPIRVVCQNTLVAALQGGAFSVAHGSDLFRRLQDARLALGLIQTEYAGIEQTLQSMAQVPMVRGQLDRYLAWVFPDPPKDQFRADQVRARLQRDRAACAGLFEAGMGNSQSGTRGTLWAAYNGVTEYVDHGRCGYTGERRLHSIWFGQGARIKLRAYQAGQHGEVWMN